MATMNDCPNNCHAGWVPCDAEECEAVMDGVGDVKPCPHCSKTETEFNVGWREDFHADV